MFICLFAYNMNYMYMHIEIIRYYSHTHAYSDQINVAGHHFVLILMQTLSFWINLLESYSHVAFPQKVHQKITKSHQVDNFWWFCCIVTNGSNAFGRFFWKKIRINEASKVAVSICRNCQVFGLFERPC